MSIAKCHGISLYEAAYGFKEAYNRNQNAESLQQQFITLLLAGNKKQFDQEAIVFELSEEEQIKYLRLVEDAKLEAEDSSAIKIIEINLTKEVSEMNLKLVQ